MNDQGQIPADSEQALEAALERLRNKKMRITNPRKAILEVLFDQEKPVSIEEIHDRLESGICDLATVYRCLALFEELGLVRLSHIREGAALYEIDRGPDHHHHILCTTCNKIESLDFCVLDGLERLVRDRGYQNVSHMLGFFGTCADCSR